ncbi:hypothetical protein L1887_36473 [Cichorium endivia]|nr:hypothetical protein L1887_36473 [Cichorium endivia]
MLAFPLPLFTFLLLFFTTTTAAQPYTPTDYFLLNCGGGTATSGRKWDTDERSKFLPSTTTSFTSTPNNRDPSVPEVPYSTARIFNTSSFTYTFPATSGPKFLRLYFYPATYSVHNANQSFFSVSSNGYSLLSNFSAFLTASYLGTILQGSPPVPHFVKEFVIYVNDTQTLNVTFTPSPNSYAFINGIEIVSLPENLYYKSKSVKYVGQNTGPVITENTALENIYRLNMGGGQISATDDTGMYRSWEQDDRYVFPVSAIGLTPVNQTPIVYTDATPNYTAPELVYATQRSMGVLSGSYNLTWLLPVDSGFYYTLRLHFCNIIPQYKKPWDVVFRIFINNQTVEEYADVLFWTQGTELPVFRDYIVFVNDLDRSGRKQDLWVAMGPNRDVSQKYGDAFLNGLEIFKISKAGSLASPNPELGPTPPPPPPASPILDNKKKTPLYAAVIGGGAGALVLFTALGFLIFRRTQVKEKSFGKTTWQDSDLPAGKIDNGASVVAIKRNASSNQGSLEFETEIGFLSKLRHFSEVAINCLREKGSKRPKMEEVIWELEFALKLQETAEETGGVMGEVTGGVMGSQKNLFSMQEEVSITEGSTLAGIRHGMSSTDSSNGGFESESFFTQTIDVSKGTSSESHV